MSSNEIESVNNEFLDLVMSPLLNVDNTIRYSLMYQVKEESLSHHLAEVSLLSYLLSLKFISLGESIDIGKVLEKVVVHDLDEVLTGDIPRCTKYYNKKGLEALREVAESAIKSLAMNVPSGEVLVQEWKSAKSGKEGKILVLCDMLCVARKVITEVKLLGNSYFLKVAYEMIDNLTYLSKTDFSEFNSSSKSYIFKLINSTLDSMRDLVSSDDRFTKYHIGNNVFYRSLNEE